MRTLFASVLVVVLATLFASTPAEAQYYYGRHRGWCRPNVVVAAPVVAYPNYGPAYNQGYYGPGYGPAVVVAPAPVVVAPRPVVFFRPRHFGYRRWRRW